MSISYRLLDVSVVAVVVTVAETGPGIVTVTSTGVGAVRPVVGSVTGVPAGKVILVPGASVAVVVPPG